VTAGHSFGRGQSNDDFSSKYTSMSLNVQQLDSHVNKGDCIQTMDQFLFQFVKLGPVVQNTGSLTWIKAAFNNNATALWWPSWYESVTAGHSFGRGPSNDYSIKVLLSQSQPNFAEMILVWSPSKIVSGISDLRPRWPPQPQLI
jgi:hypothetical protein